MHLLPDGDEVFFPCEASSITVESHPALFVADGPHLNGHAAEVTPGSIPTLFHQNGPLLSAPASEEFQEDHDNVQMVSVTDGG
jgi:hypothetical protein